MRALLTAFEPFAGEAINPSMPVVAALGASPPPGLAVTTLVLPVVYRRAWPELASALAGRAPDLLLMVGLDGGRADLAVERIAVNLDDSPLADNAGERRSDMPVLPGGPAAYFATVPVKAMAAAARDAGVAAVVSHSAGAFLCNHVLYRACHHAATEASALRCGFVHLPWLPEQPAAQALGGGMALDAMVAGVRAALAACRG